MMHIVEWYGWIWFLLGVFYHWASGRSGWGMGCPHLKDVALSVHRGTALENLSLCSGSDWCCFRAEDIQQMTASPLRAIYPSNCFFLLLLGTMEIDHIMHTTFKRLEFREHWSCHCIMRKNATIRTLHLHIPSVETLQWPGQSSPACTYTEKYQEYSHEQKDGSVLYESDYF